MPAILILWFDCTPI